MNISRRELFELALASPLGAALNGQSTAPFDRAAVATAPSRVIRADGARAEDVDVIREWNGPFCNARIVNRGRDAVRLKEVVLFDINVSLPPQTALYGEGFRC